MDRKSINTYPAVDSHEGGKEKKSANPKNMKTYKTTKKRSFEEKCFYYGDENRNTWGNGEKIRNTTDKTDIKQNRGESSADVPRLRFHERPHRVGVRLARHRQHRKDINTQLPTGFGCCAC